MSTSLSAEGIISVIGSELEHCLSDVPNWRVDSKLLTPSRSVQDDTCKLLLRDEAGSPFAVLICSDESLGDLPVRGASMSSRIKSAALGNVASSILSPLSYGSYEGISYALWPYKKPFSNLIFVRNLQRFLVARKTFPWLLELTAQSKSDIEPGLIRQKFVEPMLRLAKEPKVSSDIKQDLLAFAARAAEGKWVPRYVVEHGDLWLGNLLISKTDYYGISVIDWAGAKVEGHAIYDLARLSKSLKVSQKFYKKQLELHCLELDCDLGDSSGYLLSSFASLRENLEHFPYAKFVQLMESTYRFHRDGLSS